MGTVRDRAELGTEVRAGAVEIEVRGSLAREFAQARWAAGASMLAAVGACVSGGAVAGVAAWHGEPLATDARIVALGMATMLLMAGSTVFALRKGGLHAFRTLRGYREVHRSQGVVVLRRT